MQFAALLFCSVPVFGGTGLITGVVHNATKAQVAAGDEVVLISLYQRPHEEARTKTDSQGIFALESTDPHAHLVRVIHQGVTYDQRVSTSGPISVDVFDSRAKASGISGGIEIIRAGMRGNDLHVSDMIEIKNASNPPVTQAGARTFEVYLPRDATIQSVLAAGPENIAVSISAERIRAEPGHYTVNFPLRPGATKFAFNYDVAYNGHRKFRAKCIYPFQQLAVMIPPTMKFTTRSLAFQALPVVSDRYHVEAAENLRAGVGLEFEISGVGALPARAQSGTAPNSAEAATRPVSASAGRNPPMPNATAASAGIAKVAVRTSFVLCWALSAALLAFGIHMCRKGSQGWSNCVRRVSRYRGSIQRHPY